MKEALEYLERALRLRRLQACFARCDRGLYEHGLRCLILLGFQARPELPCPLLSHRTPFSGKGRRSPGDRQLVGILPLGKCLPLTLRETPRLLRDLDLAL